MTAPASLPTPPPVTNTAPMEPPPPASGVPAAPPAPAFPPAASAPPAAAPQGPSWAVPPPPQAIFDYRQHIGATCLVVVHKATMGVVTQYGVKTMVDATVVELAGPAPGVYEDIQLYSQQLVGQLEGLVGQYTLGRFAHGQGKSAIMPTVLNPPTPEDGAMAQAWFAANPGKMEEIQRVGKLRADTPKPPPQQAAPMAGQQWSQSPTQGYPQQSPYPQPPQQPQQAYPWQQAQPDLPPF